MVNILNIKFETVSCDYLMCFVRFIDTGFRKFDGYKHVQSANIV